MINENIWQNEELVKILKEGGVAVVPTDTIYGLVGRADILETVERIYELKDRPKEKPFVTLISGVDDLEKFGIFSSEGHKIILEKYWSNELPVSIVIDCGDRFSYLHRGMGSVPFRLPFQEKLKKLIKEVGPIIATSVNLSGGEPAKTIEEGKNYFGGSVDLYVDGGEIVGKASKIIRLKDDGTEIVIRE